MYESRSRLGEGLGDKGLMAADVENGKAGFECKERIQPGEAIFTLAGDQWEVRVTAAQALVMLTHHSLRLVHAPHGRTP